MHMFLFLNTKYGRGKTLHILNVYINQSKLENISTETGFIRVYKYEAMPDKLTFSW